MTKLRNYDIILTLIIFSLSIFGLLTTYSNTFNNGLSDVFQKQLLYFLVGYIIYFALSKFDYNYLAYFNIFIPIYIINIVLLILVLIVGIDVNGVRRWIDLGIFQLQVSEFTKLTGILTVAIFFNNIYKKYEYVKRKKVLSKLRSNIRSVLKFLLLLSLNILLALLIFIEPSAGSATLFLLVCLATIFFSYPNRLKLFLYLFILFLTSNIFLNIVNSSFIYNLFSISELRVSQFDALGLSLSILIITGIWIIFKLNYKLVIPIIIIGIVIPSLLNVFWNSNILKTYQKERVTAFFQASDPKYQDKDNYYQIKLANSAISQGFLFGKGYLKGDTPVPFKYTDFAFTSLAEEFGIVGSSILCLLFFLLCLRILLLSQIAENMFSKVLCIGISFLIFIQFSLNIAINLGLIVNTGVPLPFFSYGGSSLITIFIALGLCNSIYVRRTKDIRIRKY